MTKNPFLKRDETRKGISTLEENRQDILKLVNDCDCKEHRTKRDPCVLQVKLKKEEEWLNCRTSDISINGFFICTEDSRRPEQIIQVSFPIKGQGSSEDQLRLLAIVVHRIEPDVARAYKRQVGIGCRILDSNRKNYARWKKFFWDRD